MGITGLLPFLENATRTCHISEFRGATVAVDTYCWLHKGANACAMQLASGEKTQIYVNYCIKYIKMLQHYNIRPILVFDGKNLPAKADTEAKRRESRKRAKQRATELLRLGKSEEARTYLKQAINVTPEMAAEVIKECHKMNVDCIVAPYESDAQLAFFNLKGIAEFVITEDSDLVLFGCTKIIFKLDLQGAASLVDAAKIPIAMNLRPDKYTFDKFRYMCILSGCDYIESLRGIGLKKALKFISLTEETNPEIFLDKIPRYLNMLHLKITDEYKEKFMIAEATFRHQTVFDPFKRKLVPLVEPEVTGTNPKFCKNAGDIFDHEKAYQVALGNLHPTTFERLNDWSPPNEAGSSTSIWFGTYKKSVSRFEQKAQFKSFFTTSTTKVKVETKMEVDVEQVKIEEDLQFAKELEFYRKKTKVEEATTSVTQENEVVIEDSSKTEPTSPILKRNPFIKKRLSKFRSTNSDSEMIVKSRYFSQDSTNVQVACVEHEARDEIKETERSSELEIKTKDGADFGTTDEEVTINITSEVKRERTCDDIIEIADEVTDISGKVGIEQFRKVSPKKENNENTQKRKKMGSCRSVGLKRTKSDSGTQQTLQQLLARFKKK